MKMHLRNDFEMLSKWIREKLFKLEKVSLYVPW